MLKFIKSILLWVILISTICSVCVFAESEISVNAGEEFLSYPRDTERLSEILNMQSDDITDYCIQNNIVYLAADKTNSRQIRGSVYKNEFSDSVTNISELSDDKIGELAQNITGVEGIRGEIVNKNGQKFLKTQLLSKDSGGSYVLTQYYTVADKKNIVLSFYNAENINTDYIEKSFETYSSPLFLNNNKDSSKIAFYIIPIATVMLVIICIVLGISIINDLKNADEEDETEENPEENSEE